MTDAADSVDTAGDDGAAIPDFGYGNEREAEPAFRMTTKPEADGEAEADKPDDGGWIGKPEGAYSEEGIALQPGEDFDEETLGKLGEVCAEIGLSQKAFAHIVTTMGPFLQERSNSAIQEGMREGLKAVYADPEIGGARYQQTINTCNKFLSRHVDQEAVQVLKDTGLACHPAFIRMFYNLAQNMSEDGVARGGRYSSSAGLQGFFNNSKMN